MHILALTLEAYKLIKVIEKGKEGRKEKKVS